MLPIGCTFLFLGTALMVWTLFWQIERDRLPHLLLYDPWMPPQKLPRGTILTKRALWMTLSGCFWGVGAVLAMIGVSEPEELIQNLMSGPVGVLTLATIIAIFLAPPWKK